MYKLVLLAFAVVAANAGIVNHGYGIPAVAYAGYGHGVAPAGYAHGYGGVAHATPVHVAPAAHAYALPPIQTIENAPLVATVVEPVEQWGYKIAY